MANPDKAKDVEDVTSTQMLQRWDLKVSIHCEGCKRKVHKIISNIQGVVEVGIDLKQNKVSVSGCVDPRMVIWKLEKAGKHAELWPQKEKPVTKESKRQGKDKSGDKQSSILREEDCDRSGRESGKVEEKPERKGVAEAKAGDGKGRNPEDSRNKGPEMVQKPVVVESRAGTSETVAATAPGGGQSSADPSGDAGKIGDGNIGNKKKKSKVQNGKREASERNEVLSGEKDAAARSTGPREPEPNIVRTNEGHPHHRRVQHPEHNDHQCPNHGPPAEEFPAGNYGYYDYPPPRYNGPPVYAVNYHTTRPSSSYGASQYYAPHPPMNSYHGYMHPRQEDLQRSYYDPYYQRPPESFQMFSDENPNACALM